MGQGQDSCHWGDRIAAIVGSLFSAGIITVGLSADRDRIVVILGDDYRSVVIGAGLGSCSFCSNQMSECERFAQIAQDK